LTAAQTVAHLDIPATPEGLDSLLAWASRGIHEGDGPTFDMAADVVEMAALDFGGLEALVLGRPVEVGARRRFRERRTEWHPNPDRMTWERVNATVPDQPKFVFTVQPLVRGPVWTMAERAGAVARADEERVERARQRAQDNPGRRQRVEMDAGQREALAVSLGGRRTGESVRGVTCPSCAERSVWWFVDPVGKTWTGAACAHRKTCGWAGGFEIFGGGA
jgi:hypothetical protein